jgi:D-glycero-D-manno-heptose 1,7-bisphosphate phosphatase
MTSTAAFLDRDGTINERPVPHRYVEAAENFRWLPGAAEGLTRLARAGLSLVIVSNQRGIARGLVSWRTLGLIESEIQRELRSRGTEIASFRYCPHALADDCDCRKPRPGMLLDAARELDLDLARSWMIGDTGSDVQAGIAAGCRTVLIGEQENSPRPSLRAADLLEASELVLAEL